MCLSVLPACLPVIGQFFCFFLQFFSKIFCQFKNLPYLCTRKRENDPVNNENIERFTIETRVVQEQETAPFGAAEKLKSIL